MTSEEPRRMSPENCEHGDIRTFRAVSEPEVVVLWACANPDCSIRFYPACPVCVDVGHRNVVHPEPVR